jgi:hypothetical protein
VNDLIWIDERDVLALHNRVLALYGGAPGVRERGLRLSALAIYAGYRIREWEGLLNANSPIEQDNVVLYSPIRLGSEAGPATPKNYGAALSL